MQSFKQYLQEDTASNSEYVQRIRDLLNDWASQELIPNDPKKNSLHGFKISASGIVDCQLGTLIIYDEMLDANGEFPFKIRNAKYMILERLEKLKSFKNFPEKLVCKSDYRDVFITYHLFKYRKITSFENFPKYCPNGEIQLEAFVNASFSNIHKHILDAETIRINPNYVGPILSFLKIPTLTDVYAFTGDVNDESESCKEALSILNKHLNGNRDFIACQRELIEKDLDEYAEL
jgi:hypothetical protein